jgi:hypothetical protein
MNTHPSAHIDQTISHISAEDAWRLWHKLNQLAESIWEAHEKEFLEFCMEEAEDQCYGLPPPSD